MAQEFINLLKEKLGDDVVETSAFRGDDTAVVRRDAWVKAIDLLKSEGKIDMLLDLCGVDFPERLERFEVVAHLYSTEKRKRFRIKTRCTAKDPSVPSLVDLFCAANWFEREAFDLFGIRFEGHPSLKRILCHQNFEGHPLQKDYPKTRRGQIPAPDKLRDEIG